MPGYVQGTSSRDRGASRFADVDVPMFPGNNTKGNCIVVFIVYRVKPALYRRDERNRQRREHVQSDLLARTRSGLPAYVIQAWAAYNIKSGVPGASETSPS